MRSGVRHCEGLAVLDAHAAGQRAPVSVRPIGPDLVFGRLWQERGLPEVLRTLLKGRRYGWEVEGAIYLTVLHRLFAPGSDRAADRWRENDLIPGAETLELHHLYRAMAFLGEAAPESPGQKPSASGPPRCLKDRIEAALFERRRDRFTEVDLVFFDPTSLYFEGAGGEGLGERGFNKDHRPDLRQRVVGLAVDVQGRPICGEFWPGNTADVTTLKPVVDRLRQRFRLREITVVADSGRVSQATLEAFEASVPPVRYIVGVRMRRQKEVSTEVLGQRGRWFESVPQAPEPQGPRPAQSQGSLSWRRVATWSASMRKSGAKTPMTARPSWLTCASSCARAIRVWSATRATAGISKLKGKVTSKSMKRRLRSKRVTMGCGCCGPTPSWRPKRWPTCTKTCGRSKIGSARPNPSWKERPVYHKCGETIRGHVFCSFLALVLKCELESRLRQSGVEWEWAEVIRGLDNLHQVEATLQGRRFLLRSHLQGHASQALRAAGVAIPPTLRELA
jgi:hypothetical protein